MSSYTELVRQKESVFEELKKLRFQKSSQESRKSALEQALMSNDDNRKLKIEKEKSIALNDDISKASLVYEDALSQLDLKREKLAANRDKKLAKINFEDYYKKYGDKDTGDLEAKCLEIRRILSEKQGERLAVSLAQFYPTDGINNSSLEELNNQFDDIDGLLRYVSRNSNSVETILEGIFEFDFDKLSQNGAYVAMIVIVGILGIFLLKFSPVLIILLLPIMGYQIFRSYMFHKCHYLINSIEPNIESIKKSIDEGVMSKMKSDEDEIDRLFQSKLKIIDDRYVDTENALAQIIEETEQNFVFNEEPISRSFVDIKMTTQRDIENTIQQISNLGKSISAKTLEITEIEKEIVKETSRIRSSYYPNNSDYTTKSFEIPKDILLDILDGKPIISNLPTDSSLIICSTAEERDKFITLMLASLYSRTRVVAFDVTYFDNLDMGRAHTMYHDLANFNLFTESKNFLEIVSDLPSEITRKEKIKGTVNIIDYNRRALEEDSSPLNIKIVIDKVLDPNVFNERGKQVIRNGFSAGVNWISVVTANDIDLTKEKSLEVLEMFPEIYLLDTKGLSKKTMSFFKKLVQK